MGYQVLKAGTIYTMLMVVMAVLASYINLSIVLL